MQLPRKHSGPRLLVKCWTDYIDFLKLASNQWFFMHMPTHKQGVVYQWERSNITGKIGLSIAQMRHLYAFKRDEPWYGFFFFFFEKQHTPWAKVAGINKSNSLHFISKFHISYLFWK